MKFAPTIAELLGILFDQQYVWDDRPDFGEDTIAYWPEELAKRVAKAKAPKQLEGDEKQPR